MSHEGYSQLLCKNGHYYTWDAGTMPEEPPLCPHCKAQNAFENMVDQINGNDFGVIPDFEWEKLCIKQEVKEVCNMGHSHVLEQAQYRIPNKDEYENMRHYFDFDAGDFKLLSEFGI